MVAAQTPDGETPANEGVCDELRADYITKGLYGLCVAFCEAQDCEATLDEATGEVTFSPGCLPSNSKLLENYYRRKTPADPPMPCRPASGCPCWTEEELDAVADGVTNHCRWGVYIQGGDIMGGGETAWVAVWEVGECYVSFINSPSGERIIRYFELETDEYRACGDSIAAECESRGF
jgi:hypothetical protein